MKISITNLFRVAKRFIAALVKYVELPVTHTSPTSLKAALKTARTTRTAHVAAVRATRVAVTKQKTLREGAIAFAELCRDTLMPALGRSWNSAWAPAGWKNNTLSVPRSLAGVVGLLEDLQQFLTAHPEQENEKHQLTADDVQDYLDRLDAAEGELSTAKTTQRQARTARDKAEGSLMEQTRGLVAELELILTENDERWIEFTGGVPGDEQRPEPVEALVLSGEVAGKLDADWEETARSERFIVQIKVVGTDSDYRHVATVRDPNVTLSDLPPGAEVKVRIVAANAAGEAAPSDEETATVPVLSKAA